MQVQKVALVHHPVVNGVSLRPEMRLITFGNALNRKVVAWTADDDQLLVRQDLHGTYWFVLD